jgi:3-dehydroquinate synthetase
MTDEEIITYFEAAILPETLRLDRATTQLNVKESVKSNIKLMLADPKDTHSRHRLNRIADAMENPYNGPEIPRF